MKKMRVGVLTVFALLAACTASLPPAETTADGLVRVASRPEGGVYRKVNVDFTHYKRLMIEPLTVEFVKGWRKQHPDVSKSEVRRIEAETRKNFLEVFRGILVDEGPFELAEVREPDVLMVVPRMLDLKIPAPESEADTGYRSYSQRPVSLQMTGELRDGVNGEVLLRVNMIDAEDRYKVSQISGPNRVTNAREIAHEIQGEERRIAGVPARARASSSHA